MAPFNTTMTTPSCRRREGQWLVPHTTLLQTSLAPPLICALIWAPDVTAGAAYTGITCRSGPWLADSCLFVFLTIYIHCSLTSAVLGWSHAKPHILRRWAAMLQYQVIVTTEENYEVRTVKAIRCKIISDNKKDRNSSIISLEWNVFLAPNTETPQVLQNPVLRHVTVYKIINNKKEENGVDAPLVSKNSLL